MEPWSSYYLTCSKIKITDCKLLNTSGKGTVPSDSFMSKIDSNPHSHWSYWLAHYWGVLLFYDETHVSNTKLFEWGILSLRQSCEPTWMSVSLTGSRGSNVVAALRLSSLCEMWKMSKPLEPRRIDLRTGKIGSLEGVHFLNWYWTVVFSMSSRGHKRLC